MTYSLFLVFGITVVPIGGIDVPIEEIDFPRSKLKVVSTLRETPGP